MAKKEERFVCVHTDGHQLNQEGQRKLLVDKETGVTYLTWHSGYAGGITPLLDGDGKPVITKL